MLIFQNVIIVVMQKNTLVLRQIHAEIFRDEVTCCLQLTCKMVQQKEGRKEKRGEQ